MSCYCRCRDADEIRRRYAAYATPLLMPQNSRFLPQRYIDADILLRLMPPAATPPPPIRRQPLPLMPAYLLMPPILMMAELGFRR